MAVADRASLDRRRRLLDISLSDLATDAQINPQRLWAFLRADLPADAIARLERVLAAAEAEQRL